MKVNKPFCQKKVIQPLRVFCSAWVIFENGGHEMNKTELVKAVSAQAELTQKDAAKAVDAIFETILNTLAQNEKIQLIGFGTFEVRERSARKGRNPQTGEEIEIAASKVPAFKPGKELKEAIR